MAENDILQQLGLADEEEETPKTPEEYLAGDATTVHQWWDQVYSRIRSRLTAQLNAADIDPWPFQIAADSYKPQLFEWFHNTFYGSNLKPGSGPLASGSNLPSGVAVSASQAYPSEFAALTTTADGLESLARAGFAQMMNYLNLGQLSYDFAPRGAGGGGRGGSRAPTADEIRAQFDLDELSRAATDIYRSIMLDEPKNARALAENYVEAVVTNPDQRLDFESFVHRQLENTPRFKALYRNKPKGLSPEYYLQYYLQPAIQTMGAGSRELQEVVEGAMKMGTSAGGFAGRLDRTREANLGSPFLSRVAKRTHNLRRMLR
jgi:hypothetical protein